jgi:hypothetical protein
MRVFLSRLIGAMGLVLAGFGHGDRINARRQVSRCSDAART